MKTMNVNSRIVVLMIVGVILAPLMVDLSHVRNLIEKAAFLVGFIGGYLYLNGLLPFAAAIVLAPICVAAAMQWEKRNR
jgi:hypothetical protein